MHLAQTALDATLVATCCAYAAWLDTHKDLEPDHTWAEVTAGVALCLGHAAARHRLDRGDYEATVWRSFALGAAPIIVGELRQWLARRAARSRYLAQGFDDLGS